MKSRYVFILYISCTLIRVLQTANIWFIAVLANPTGERWLTTCTCSLHPACVSCFSTPSVVHNTAPVFRSLVASVSTRIYTGVGIIRCYFNTYAFPYSVYITIVYIMTRISNTFLIRWRTMRAWWWCPTVVAFAQTQQHFPPPTSPPPKYSSVIEIVCQPPRSRRRTLFWSHVQLR